MNKIDIKAFSNNERYPYEHLSPIVDALLQEGNRIAGSSKFYLDKDGWRCDLVKPINFQLIRDRFNSPASIRLSEEYDSILCQHTWVEIKGSVRPTQKKTLHN